MISTETLAPSHLVRGVQLVESLLVYTTLDGPSSSRPVVARPNLLIMNAYDMRDREKNMFVCVCVGVFVLLTSPLPLPLFVVFVGSVCLKDLKSSSRSEDLSFRC